MGINNKVCCTHIGTESRLESGSIVYRVREDKKSYDFYIITEVGGSKFVAVSLQDGFHWTTPERTVEGALDGMSWFYVHSGSKLEITVNCNGR